MIDDTRGEDAFAERIARPLRAREGADATFEARAMSAVHAEARFVEDRLASRWWLLRPRAVRISPLASLALAAGLAGLILAGSSAIERLKQGWSRDATPVAQSADTVHVVRFVLVDSGARRVALVGTFNQWQKDATLLKASGTSGVWIVDLSLPAGRHEYAFIVYDNRGEHWVADPLTPAVHDEFGTESSVVSVGTRSSS